MLDVAHCIAEPAVSLINDSPRVEGNNVTVDLQTDHPVQCSIRLALTSSPLRDCESISFSFMHLHRAYILFLDYYQVANSLTGTLS